MADIKVVHSTASIIDNERVVFNIAGHKYRLVVKVWFKASTVWVKVLGTHAEYDRIDVTEV